MSHIVTCRWCHEKFDTDEMSPDEWVASGKSGKAYYHKKCYIAKGTPGAQRPERVDSSDAELFKLYLESIIDFIERDLRRFDYDPGRIGMMMKDYRKKYGYTYKGMFFSVKYFFEIKKNSWDKANGAIGIVPYVYQEATDYWVEREAKESGILAKIEKQIAARAAAEPIVIKKKQEKKKKYQYDFE